MLTKDKAIAELQQQIGEIQTLKSKPNFSPEFKKWHRDTEVAIENIFGQGARHVKDFNDVSYSLMMISSGTPDLAFREEF